MNRVLNNIVLSSNKSGKTVKIKVLTGPLAGKEYQANKVVEKDGICYHIENEGIKTYFIQKDIIEL